MDRRVFVQSVAATSISPGAAKSFEGSSAALLVAMVDHLIYATPDLDQGVRYVESLTGLVATPGGTQRGQGTRNALVALGPATYLEIRAPDPAQDNTGRRSPFFERISEFPRLFRWAAKSHDLKEQIRRAGDREVFLGEIQDGQRQKPDGSVVNWRMTDPKRFLGDGLVPFFIDWGGSPHPARGLAPGACLIKLEAQHPEAGSVSAMPSKLSVPLRVTSGATPRLTATIECPKGLMKLS